MKLADAKPKQIAADLIARLPDDASFEDIQYQLYVLDKVRRGEEDIRAGRVHTPAEARALLAKWLAH